MVGTLFFLALATGAGTPARDPAPPLHEALQLDFEIRIDGLAERAPDRGDRGGVPPGVDGAGPAVTQVSGAHPGSGGMTSPPGYNLPPEAGPGPENLRFYVIHIGGFGKGTKTGFWEEFMLYAPAPSKPRPLLVVFHKYNVGWADARDNTEFFAEGIRRRWYIMCQLGASGRHLSSIESQQNTEVALNWVFANFNIDMNRIYGVGFSMGGGAVANYAARHLDPKDHMFAAILVHTGIMSHNDTYLNSVQTQFVFEYWFGNPPGVGNPLDPFAMARSSLIDFHPQTLVVNTQNDMARNLTHVPTKVTYASNEPAPTAYLTVQNQVFAQHLSSPPLSGNVLTEVVPFSGHSWDMIDEAAVCSWLANWDLRVPANARTLADRDGPYFFFDIAQETPGSLTPFKWSINEAENKIVVYKTQNLKRVEIDLQDAGLSTTQMLRVVLEADDGNADRFRVIGWPSEPSEVRRDTILQPINTTWTFSTGPEGLTINEFDPGLHDWNIYP